MDGNKQQGQRMILILCMLPMFLCDCCIGLYGIKLRIRARKCKAHAIWLDVNSVSLLSPFVAPALSQQPAMTMQRFMRASHSKRDDAAS